jgi:TonB family protein
MKKPGALAAAVVLILFASGFAHGADVVVIAHPSVKADRIFVAELRSVFLQEQKTLSDGSHVEPVLARSGTAHALFLKRYIGKSDDDLRNYYRTLVFTGTGWMPKSLASDAEVIEYVARTRGAIGYVDNGAALTGVKVLAVVQNALSINRTLLRRVEPEYPETLQQHGIGGTVRLLVTISPKGAVDGVSVLGGNPALAESAVKAVKQWLYAPGPSTSRQEISIPFQPRP